MEVTTQSNPVDYELMGPERLDNFVSSVVIGELDAEDTSVDAATFVASQTEAPTPRRGLLWYKRGEGQLYKCQFLGWNSTGSNATNWASGYTAVHPVDLHMEGWNTLWAWVGVSPRVETLCPIVHEVTESGLAAVLAEKNPLLDDDVRDATFWTQEAGEVPLLATRDHAWNQNTSNPSRVHGANWILKDTGATWSPMVAVVRGFTDVRLEFSAACSNAQPLRIRRTHSGSTEARFAALGFPRVLGWDENSSDEYLVGWAREARANSGSETSLVSVYKAHSYDMRRSS
jgi:hypothetical protein